MGEISVEGCGKALGGLVDLFGGFAGGEALAALPLYLIHAPRARGAAIDTFADISAKSFEVLSV
jgi:hypothetical protein